MGFVGNIYDAGIAQRQSNCLVSSRSGYRNSLPAPSECSSVWLEHLIAIQKVAGSSPVIPSIGSWTSIKSHQDNRKSQQWNTRRNNSVIKFVQPIEITCDWNCAPNHLKIDFSINFWYNIYRKWNTLGVYSKPNLVNKNSFKQFLSRFEPYKFMRLEVSLKETLRWISLVDTISTNIFRVSWHCATRCRTNTIVPRTYPHFGMRESDT